MPKKLLSALIANNLSILALAHLGTLGRTLPPRPCKNYTLRETCGLTQTNILNHKVTRNSICKHAGGRSAFLVRREAKLAKGILFALKVWVICYHSLPNTVEHMSRHMEVTAKFVTFEESTILKVIGVEKGVASLPIAIQGRNMSRIDPLYRGRFLLMWSWTTNVAATSSSSSEDESSSEQIKL